MMTAPFAPSPKRPASPPEEAPAPKLARCFLAETLGTFVLTLGSLGADVLARSGLLTEAAAHALPPGLIVLAMIYVLGDVSGAHINPAVTLAFALRGAFPWRRAPLYLGAQLLGALLAAGLLRFTAGLPVAAERVPALGAAALEVGCAGLLVLVILVTAKRKAKIGPNLGLVVGLTLALCHFLGDAVSDVTMNPARTLAPALLEGRLGAAVPHLLGQLGGALLAVGLTWALLGPRDAQEDRASRGEGG